MRDKMISVFGFLVLCAGCASHAQKCLDLDPTEPIFSSPDFFRFQDPGLNRYSLQHWDTNKDCSLSQSELGAVTEIPSRAFEYTEEMSEECRKDQNSADCLIVYSLDELKLLKNLKLIGNRAFAYQPAIEIIEHSSVETIGRDVFEQCIHLHTVILPNLKSFANPIRFRTCSPQIITPMTSEKYFPAEIPIRCVDELAQKPDIRNFYIYFENECTHQGMKNLLPHRYDAYRLTDLDNVKFIPPQVFQFAFNWSSCHDTCSTVSSNCYDSCSREHDEAVCEYIDDPDNRYDCEQNTYEELQSCNAQCSSETDYCSSRCDEMYKYEIYYEFNKNDCAIDLNEFNYMRNLTKFPPAAYRGRKTTGEFYTKTGTNAQTGNTVPAQVPIPDTSYSSEQLPVPAYSPAQVPNADPYNSETEEIPQAAPSSPAAPPDGKSWSVDSIL